MGSAGAGEAVPASEAAGIPDRKTGADWPCDPDTVAISLVAIKPREMIANAATVLLGRPANIAPNSGMKASAIIAVARSSSSSPP